MAGSGAAKTKNSISGTAWRNIGGDDEKKQSITSAWFKTWWQNIAATSRLLGQHSFAQDGAMGVRRLSK